MTGWMWVKGRLRIKRAKPEPEPQPEPEKPAKPRELAEWLRRCPACHRLKVQPGENPAMYVGMCMCDLKPEP